jgi:predicted  nucleic acid-binding Zn-ribbon protein
MSQVFSKLQEIESQIDGELKQIDKKMRELKQQRLKLTGLHKAVKPKAVKPRRIAKVEGGITENSKDNS